MSALEIEKVIYGLATVSSIATVQSLLSRLEVKKYVKNNRTAWPHRFSSNVDVAYMVAQRLQEIADSLCSGSMKPVLNHLVGSIKPSRPECLRLKRLMDGQNG